MIQKAVKVFLESPQDTEHANLLMQIEQYKKYGVTEVGVEQLHRSRLSYVPVVQGGLPSLGKRAK